MLIDTLRRRMPGGPLDVLVYAGGLWDSPWLTEHHLARALAQHCDCRVLLVDGSRTPVYALRASGWREAPRAMSDLARKQLVSEEGLWVLRPVTLPPARSLQARRVSRPLVRTQQGRALRALNLRPQLILTARTVHEGLPAAAAGAVQVALVKDWLQAGAHLTGRDPAKVRVAEHAEWNRADIVCAVSRPLQRRLEQDGFSARLLRHGYADDLRSEEAVGVVPEQLAGLPRPLLGSLGRIDGRYAFDQLEQVADRYANGTLVLVGPLSSLVPRARFDRLLARPNVRHFPAVPAREVARWNAALDCCLIPYVADEWQRFASPIKVWDYLASGRPIVATGAPALGEFPPGLLHFDLDEQALPDLVAAALDGEPPRLADERREYAHANTWAQRAKELLHLAGLSTA